MIIDSSIPLPLQVWLMNDDYDYQTKENYISATQLLQPTRSIVLASKIPISDEIDLKSLIAPKMGNAIHDSIESVWSDESKRNKALLDLGYPEKIIKSLDIHIEERAIKSLGEYTIGGKFDMVINGNLFDFKSTSVYSWINSDKDEDYALQGSIYRWLNPELIQSDTVNICFIFTDWSAQKATYEANYPKSRIASKEIPLLSIEQTERWIMSKLKDISEQSNLSQNEMKQCTDKELWRSSPKYKYYSSGDTSKRATKVFDSLLDANTYKAKNNNKGIVTLVPGMPKRCNYCYAAIICEQRKQMLGDENE